MQLLKNARENLLQTSVALLAIAATAYLPTLEAVRNNTLITIFLTIFAAFGGALLNKALEGTSMVEDRVFAKIRDRLRPVNRNLASITKELTTVTRGSDANRITATETVKLIDQLVPNLIGAMTDIGDVAGEPFDPKTIYQTAHQVEELDKLLSSLSRYSRDNRQKSLILAAQSTLAEIHPDVYKRVAETVKCPYCNAANQILIGMQHPASASPTCIGCGQMFHAHRHKDLHVFTARHGSKTASPAGTRQVEITCDCGVTFRCHPNPQRSTRKLCFACGLAHMLDSDGRSQALPPAKLTRLEFSPDNVREKELFCTDHHAWVHARYTRGDFRSGYCDAGSHVIAFVNCPVVDHPR